MYSCRCEAELTFASWSGSVFIRHQRRVDKLLAASAPDALDKLNAAFRRGQDGDPESGSQGLMSCRRALLAVADVVFPAQDEPYIDSERVSHSVGASNYRNRLFAHLDKTSTGGTAAYALLATLDGLIERIEAVDDLAQKGVHAVVSQEEVELCAVQMYLLAGELLALHDLNAT
jgi:hypothetical protein